MGDISLLDIFLQQAARRLLAEIRLPPRGRPGYVPPVVTPPFVSRPPPPTAGLGFPTRTFPQAARRRRGSGPPFRPPYPVLVPERLPQPPEVEPDFQNYGEEGPYFDGYQCTTDTDCQGYDDWRERNGLYRLDPCFSDPEGPECAESHAGQARGPIPGIHIPTPTEQKVARSVMKPRKGDAFPGLARILRTPAGGAASVLLGVLIPSETGPEPQVQPQPQPTRPPRRRTPGISPVEVPYAPELPGGLPTRFPIPVPRPGPFPNIEHFPLPSPSPYPTPSPIPWPATMPQPVPGPTTRPTSRPSTRPGTRPGPRPGTRPTPIRFPYLYLLPFLPLPGGQTRPGTRPGTPPGTPQPRPPTLPQPPRFFANPVGTPLTLAQPQPLPSTRDEQCQCDKPKKRKKGCTNPVVRKKHTTLRGKEFIITTREVKCQSSKKK